MSDEKKFFLFRVWVQPNGASELVLLCRSFNDGSKHGIEMTESEFRAWRNGLERLGLSLREVEEDVPPISRADLES